MIFSIPFELLALTLFASVLSLIGGITFLYTKRLSVFLEKYGVPFAAGTMIVTALVGLLPEAMHALGVTSLVVFTFSFLLLFVIEKLLLQVHHHSHADNAQTKHTLHTAVPIVLIGDTLHNFIDGVAIAVAYAVNPGLAVVTALSTFLHEVPHEIGDFSILLKAGFSKKKVLIINVLSGLASILGVVLVSYISPSEDVMGYLLAITAGMFFYLGVVDFLPQAFDSSHHDSFASKLTVVAAVLGGAAVIALSLMAVPHSHEHAHADEDSHLYEQEGEGHDHTKPDIHEEDHEHHDDEEHHE